MATSLVRSLRSWWIKNSLGRARGGKWTSAGGVVLNDEGELALVKQRGRRRDLRWTFPKGRVDPGETGDEAARREVYEETGLHARITGYLGMYEGPRNFVHYYLMVLERDDGVFDSETKELRFVKPASARKLLRSVRDRSVLKRAIDHLLGVKSKTITRDR